MRFFCDFEGDLSQGFVGEVGGVTKSIFELSCSGDSAEEGGVLFSG